MPVHFRAYESSKCRSSPTRAHWGAPGICRHAIPNGPGDHRRQEQAPDRLARRSPVRKRQRSSRLYLRSLRQRSPLACGPACPLPNDVDLREVPHAQHHRAASCHGHGMRTNEERQRVGRSFRRSAIRAVRQLTRGVYRRHRGKLS